MTRFATSFYRLLLHAFPAPFRSRHGAQMVAQFEAHQAGLAGRPLALIGFWCRAMIDAIVHGLAVRRAHRVQAMRPRVSNWTADVYYALRGFRRDRGITLAILAILTVGIAATTVMFGVVDRLLLQPPAGVGDAETLRRLHFGSVSRPTQSGDRHSYPAVTAIRAGAAAFNETATTHLARVTVGGGIDAAQASAQLVDADYFSVLRLRPSVGQFFGSPGSTTAEASAVLSHAFWQRRFAGDPRAVGQTIRIEGQTFTIVGVGPADFKGVESRPVDLWVPTPALAPTVLGARWMTNPGRFAFGLIVRLAPDASAAQADAQATAALRAAMAELPGGDDGRAFIAPLQRLESPGGVLAEGRVALWLLCVAAVVLLVAIANVTGLILTRAWSRRRDAAIRVALGASRARLLRQSLIESALLATVAAAAAIVITYLTGHAIRQLLLPGFAWPDGVVDGRVLAVSIAVAALTAFALAIPPARQADRGGALASLRVSSIQGRGRATRFRTALLVMQLSLSVVLLIGAGLFVRSLIALHRQDVGADLDRVVLATLPDRPGQPVADVEALYADAHARVSSLARVERVTIARGSALLTLSVAVPVARDGWSDEELRGRPAPQVTVVGADYFSTLGASIERGRDFSADDERTRAAVVVINRALAQDVWPDVDPVGQCVRLASTQQSCSTIVGVVENILSFDRVDTGQAQLYLLPSHPQNGIGMRPRALLVRLKGDVDAAVPMVRHAIQTLRPDMPFVDVSTLASKSSPQLQPWRLGATMFVLFGGLALLIAAAGVFSAMANAVAHRYQEIGIRLALGAPPWTVVAQIARHGAVVIAVGAAVGVAAAFALAPRVADLLHATSPRDPTVFAVVVLALLCTGVLATVLPARRAARLDPLRALRRD